MSIRTLGKVAATSSLLALSAFQLNGVLVKSAFGIAPLTAPLTGPTVTTTPTPTGAPLTAPVDYKVGFYLQRSIDHVYMDVSAPNTGYGIYVITKDEFTHIVTDQHAYTYKWSVLDTSVASVSPFAVCTNGIQPPCPMDHAMIKGLKPGNTAVIAEIYDQAGDQWGMTAFELTVTDPAAPLTSPEQGGQPSETPTPTVTPTITPEPVPAPNNNNNSNNNGGGNNGGGSSGGGGSSSGGGSNNGGNVCRDERPKSAPIILNTRATGPNQVTITWRKGWAPFNGFVISYGTKRGITQFTMDTPNTTLATVSGLNPNTIYYFKVQAKNGCVSGDYSRELSVRTYGKIIAKTTVLGSKTKKIIPVKKIVKPLVIKKKK